MKRRFILAATLLVGIAGSQSAEAQYRRPNERIVVSMKVDSWGPHNGAAGTVVQMNGRGFTRKTEVLIGGRKIRPLKIGPKTISFRVPSSIGNGQIVLRKIGSANDYVVGTFHSYAPPQLGGFAPASGAAGTRVQLRGRDLSQVTRVTLGSTPLKIDQYTPNGAGIVVTIPQGAASGYFNVYDKRNTVSKSRRMFQVVAPAPYISGFSPNHGQPGSILRLTGGNYGNDVRISYGRSPMRIIRQGNGWLEVAIPPRARRNQQIVVSSPRGGVRSAGYFTLEQPPILGSYSPNWGSVGTRVQINGRNFMAGDRVTLGGQTCKIIQIQDGRITVEIPPNAPSGAFAIHRGAQVIQSASRFDVVYAPQITNLSPWQGAPGTVVNVTGSNFIGAKFYIGNTPIRPNWVKPNQMQFVLPSRVSSGQFRAETRGGGANWAKPINIWNFPGIKRITPSRGGYGTQITLYGSQLANATQISLGGVAMPIVTRARDRIVVRVPRGARSGPISWTAYGQTQPTRWNFSVLQAPVLRSYSPTEGGPGTAITISGQGFDRNTRVFYGKQQLRVSRWSATSLNVLLPANARQSDYLSLHGEGGTVRAPQPFGYLAAPTINSFWPAQIKPGAQFSIRGAALTRNTQVKVGNQNAKVVGQSRDGTLMVLAPSNLAPGNYPVAVQWRGMQSVARKSLRVEAWAQIYDIRPRIARVGQKIMLSGSGLTGAHIYYGRWELPVVKTDPRGKRIWVTIPKECSGKSVLTIDDHGHRSNTATELEIFAPVRPIDIRDHRRPLRPIRPRRRR